MPWRRLCRLPLCRRLAVSESPPEHRRTPPARGILVHQNAKQTNCSSGMCSLVVTRRVILRKSAGPAARSCHAGPSESQQAPRLQLTCRRPAGAKAEWRLCCIPPTTTLDLKCNWGASGGARCNWGPLARVRSALLAVLARCGLGVCCLSSTTTAVHHTPGIHQWLRYRAAGVLWAPPPPGPMSG